MENKKLTRGEKEIIFIAGLSAPLFAYALNAYFKNFENLTEQRIIIKKGANVGLILILIYTICSLLLEFGII